MMHRTFFQFGGLGEKERRLLREQPAAKPESLDMGILTGAASAEELDSFIAANKEKKDVLAAAREGLANLDPSKRRNAMLNMRRLQTKIAQNQELQELGQAVNTLVNEMENQEVSPAQPPAASEQPTIAQTPEQIAASQTPVGTPEQAQTFLEQTKQMAIDLKDGTKSKFNEVKEDFINGSNWTKAGYIAGGVVGFLAVRWLWRKAFGNSEENKEGFMKKGFKWFLGLSAIGVGIYGIKYLADTIKETVRQAAENFFGMGDDDKKDPNAPMTNTGAVWEGLKRGGEKSLGLGAATVDALMSIENLKLLWEQRNNYSPAEFAYLFLGACALDGIDAVYDGGKVSLVTGGKLWDLTGEWWGKALEARADDNKTPGKWQEVLAVHIEGTILYATSMTALQLATLRKVARFSTGRTLLESMAFPVSVPARIGQGGLKFIRGCFELTASNTGTKLTFRRLGQGANIIWRNIGNAWRTQTFESMLVREELYRAAVETRRHARSVQRYRKNKEIMAFFSENEEAAKNAYVTSLSKLDQSQLPKEYKNAIKGRDIVKLSDEEIDDLLERINLNKSGGVTAGTHADSAADEILETVPSSAADEVNGNAARAGAGMEGPDPYHSHYENLDERVRAKLNPLRTKYKGEALDAFDEAATRISSITENADEAAELLTDRNLIRMFGGNPVEMEKALRTASQMPDRIVAMRRVSAYLSVMERGWVVKEALNDDVIRAIAATDMEPAVIRRFFSSSATMDVLRTGQHDEILKTVKNLSTMKRAIALQRGIAFGGAALEIGGVVFDYMALQEANNRIHAALQKLNAELTPERGFTKTLKSMNGRSVEVFVHTSGVEIEATSLQDNISSLANPEKARLLLDSIGAAAATTSAVTSVVAPGLSLGPAGWIAAGVVITVHAGIGVWQNIKNRTFLQQVPLPILAMLGTAGTIGTSEQDAVADSSNWILDEIGNREVRKKALAVLFWQEMGTLAHDHPEVYGEVMLGRDMMEFMDDNGDFYKKDFPEVIAPFLSVRLFELANDSGAHWTEFSHLRIDEGFLDAGNVDPQDMRKALRESAWIYIQHLREKRYREYTVQHGEIAAQQAEELGQRESIEHLSTLQYLGEQDIELQILEQHLKELGNVRVFGVAVERIPSPDGKTQAQKMIEDARAGLDAKAYITTPQYFPGSNFSPHLRESGTVTSPQIRKNFDAKEFLIHLPDCLLPDSSRRDIPLWQLGILGINESGEENKEERYNHFLREAHKIYAEMSRKDASGYVTDRQRELCLSYFSLLQRYPEMDSDGSIREKISTLPSEGWRTEFMNDSQSWINGYLKPVQDAVARNVAWAELNRRSFVPIKREEQPVLLKRIDSGHAIAELPADDPEAAFQGWEHLFFTDEKWRREGHMATVQGHMEYVEQYVFGAKEYNGLAKPENIFVTLPDGSIKRLQGIPCTKINATQDTPFHIDGVGTFICRARRFMKNNIPVDSFDWYFKGTDPSKIYVHHFDGNLQEQPGTWLESKPARRMEFTQDYTKPFVVPAQGVQSMIVRMSDGRSFESRQPLYIPLSAELRDVLTLEKPETDDMSFPDWEGESDTIVESTYPHGKRFMISIPRPGVEQIEFRRSSGDKIIVNIQHNFPRIRLQNSNS